jgi:hypothetical protein
MLRCFVLSLAALALPAVPASAATYIGTLNGIITSGREGHYAMPPAAGYVSIDLAGDPITISFVADVIDNYTNNQGDFIPHYVRVRQTVIIPSPASDDGKVTVTSSNDPNEVSRLGPYDAAPIFNGTAGSGEISIDDSIWIFPYYHMISDISFAGAAANAGPLTGSGTISFSGRRYGTSGYGLAFRLTDGFVRSAAPEPESWALMILGFGAIGSAMRRERRRIGLKAIPA